jgi:hypothetical protein
MLEILHQCEGNISQVKSLEKYANFADRIMGAARSIGISGGIESKQLNMLGDYAGICKIVGYKAALISDNDQFYEICVALLIDGTEVLLSMLVGLQSGKLQVKQMISQTFIDRLRWISSHFGHNYSASVDIHKGQNTKLNQGDIDDLLKKLGF